MVHPVECVAAGLRKHQAKGCLCTTSEGFVTLHAEAQRSQLAAVQHAPPDLGGRTWSGLRRRRYRGSTPLKRATSGVGEVAAVAACAERVARRTARVLEFATLLSCERSEGLWMGCDSGKMVSCRRNRPSYERSLASQAQSEDYENAASGDGEALAAFHIAAVCAAAHNFAGAGECAAGGARGAPAAISHPPKRHPSPALF